MGQDQERQDHPDPGIPAWERARSAAPADGRRGDAALDCVRERRRAYPGAHHGSHDRALGSVGTRCGTRKNCPADRDGVPGVGDDRRGHGRGNRIHRFQDPRVQSPPAAGIRRNRVPGLAGLRDFVRPRTRRWRECVHRAGSPGSSGPARHA